MVALNEIVHFFSLYMYIYIYLTTNIVFEELALGHSPGISGNDFMTSSVTTVVLSPSFATF